MPAHGRRPVLVLAVLSQIIAEQTPPIPDGCGLNQDVRGTLQGLWFLPSVPVSESTSPEHRSGWLWFFYISDPHVPDRHIPRLLFSDARGGDHIGTTWLGDPLPRDVTVASGAVAFRLDGKIGRPLAVLLVQLLSDTSLRAEAFDGNTTEPRFTVNARTYIR